MMPSFQCFPVWHLGIMQEQVVRILMDAELDQDKVCHIQPMGVTKNASFIIDIADVHFADLKADDLGSWKPNGTKATYFRFLPSGTKRILSARQSERGYNKLCPD